MREIINRFTMNKPKTMIGPVLWLFFEGLFMAVPAIVIYFAINLLAVAFSDPNNIDLSGLWRFSGIMAIMMLAQFFISLGAYLQTYLPAAKNSKDDKLEFVKKLRTLPLGYFLKKKSGELINTFTGDFLAIEQSMVGMFTGLLGVIFSCIVTSIFMFMFNPTMAFAMYISIPIAALIVWLSMKLIAKYTTATLEAKDDAMTNLNEYLLGMKTLKAYNLTGESFKKLKDSYRNLMKVCIKSEGVGGSLLNFTVSLVNLGVPLMCFAGSYLILGGKLDVVTYIGLIIIATKIISPLLTWIRYTAMLRTHYVSATRIANVMKESSIEGEASIEEIGNIRFENVDFAYEEKGESVLNNVSFEIPAKRLTAIVGPSGSGKTTILRLIARFWDADNGAIICGNQDIKTLDADKWIENISMVLQDVYLFHDTIRENILFGRRDASEEEMMDAAKRAECHEFIMQLPEGYDTLVGEGGSTLSGGEKQRISIARAILKNAPILLLDEPTASLDAKNEVRIQRAISELVKGRTVIMIAHRMKTIMNSHQILVVDKGSIIESGTHQELVENDGLYKKLWDMQTQSVNWNLS